MELVSKVRETLGKECLSKKISKDGCKLSLKDISKDRCIVDFDKHGSTNSHSGNKCDYLVIVNGSSSSNWVAPIELKKGSPEANKVVKQLQAGACEAESIVGGSHNVKFRPILVSGNLHTIQRRKLRGSNSKIRFHGNSEVIRLAKCGGQLKAAFE